MRRCASGDDQRVTGVGAAIADQGEGFLGQFGGVDVVKDDFGFKAPGMGFKSLHEFRPLDTVDVGRPVVDLGGGGELSTLCHAGNQYRLEIGAGSVNGGGITGRAGAENQQTSMAGGLTHDVSLVGDKCRRL